MRTISLTCLLVSIVFPSIAYCADSPENPPSRRSFRVVGYLPSYRLDAIDANGLGLVSEVIYFSVEPDDKGELDLRRLDQAHLQKLKSLKTSKNVKLTLCVGGWGRSRNIALVAKEQATRDRFAESLLHFCTVNAFDGVDLDWEHPKGAAEEDDFGALLTAVQAQLKPKHLDLTIAVAGWQRLPKEAIAAVDRVNLMAYDGNGRHSTFKNAVADVDRLLKQGVPREKIVLGVPFYARGITNRGRTLTYAEIVKKHHPSAEVDEIDALYFNGINTIERKTRYARENGLAGVMIWELGQDSNDDASLLRAIGRGAGLMKPAPAPAAAN